MLAIGALHQAMVIGLSIAGRSPVWIMLPQKGNGVSLCLRIDHYAPGEITGRYDAGYL